MKFFSKHPSYQILYRPEVRQFAPDGTKIVLDGIKFLQFWNCMYETNDIDECIYLLKSTAYGKDIFSDIQISQIMDGTWIQELRKHLSIPAPVPEFEIEKLKKEFNQSVTPKIETRENKTEQAQFEKLPQTPTPAKV